jgi:lycopene cyclase domain-containing protein
MNPHYLYLVVDLAVIAVPLAFSFDRKVRFVRFWPALFPAIAVMMAVFIPWDIAFTERGIWGFNPDYLSGLWIAGIPLEEWLFFICIPYACIFTYESLKHYVPNPPLRPFSLPATTLLAVASAALVCSMPERIYIATTGLLTALICIVLALAAALKPAVRDWNHQLWFAYLPLLIPFILTNGVLTGLRFWQYPVWNHQVHEVADQIVWYNNDHNLSVRIFSMPVDDLFYGFLMIALTVLAYEAIARRLGMVTGAPPPARR